MFLSNQPDFLRLHLTLTCLLESTIECYSGVDLGKLMGLIFINFRKVFGKFKMISFARNSIVMVHSNLSNREQFCRFNGIDRGINSINISAPPRIMPRSYIIHRLYQRSFLVSTVLIFFHLCSPLTIQKGIHFLCIGGVGRL